MQCNAQINQQVTIPIHIEGRFQWRNVYTKDFCSQLTEFDCKRGTYGKKYCSWNIPLSENSWNIPFPIEPSDVPQSIGICDVQDYMLYNTRATQVCNSFTNIHACHHNESFCKWV